MPNPNLRAVRRTALRTPRVYHSAQHLRTYYRLEKADTVASESAVEEGGVEAGCESGNLLQAAEGYEAPGVDDGDDGAVW